MWLLTPAGYCMQSNCFIICPLVLGTEKPAGIVVNELHLHKAGRFRGGLTSKYSIARIRQSAMRQRRT